MGHSVCILHSLSLFMTILWCIVPNGNVVYEYFFNALEKEILPRWPDTSQSGSTTYRTPKYDTWFSSIAS